MDRKWQRGLTPSELAAIRVNVEEAESPMRALEEAIVGVIRLGLEEVYGKTWDEMEAIDPREFAIPDDQWRELAQMLCETSTDPEMRTQVLLNWMNLGPSGFEVAPT